MSYIRSADEGVSVCVGSERLERFTSSLARVEFSVYNTDCLNRGDTSQSHL